MRKLLFLLFILLESVVYSQDYGNSSHYPQCSRYKHSIKNLKVDPDQSPLVHNHDVKFYKLDINLENNSVEITGNVTINAISNISLLDTFAFELVNDLTIDSVLINGVNKPVLRDPGKDNVFVPNLSITQGQSFSSQIFYHGLPPTGGFFSGISTAYNSTWNKNVTWTLSEPYNAKQWFPVKQVLSDKSDSVYVFVTTSENNKVGSQGILSNIVPVPGNKVRYEWKSKYPICYYLISVSVSDYQDYSVYAHPEGISPDSILIQNFIYNEPGVLNSYKEGIDNTVNFIELFSSLYSLYPFSEEKYGHCQAEMGGAMEHQTMTTTGSFGFGIIAHELGHQWFGDNVTCATWSDIWINEGFATYSDYLAHEFIAGGNWPQIWLENTHNYVMSSPGGSVYIPPSQTGPDNVWRIFDGRLSYNKGASILHMMRFEVQNDSLFFLSFRNFQTEFSDSTATGLDFKAILENTTGISFGQFFDQWYFGEGYPTYDIGWHQENDTLFFTSYQSTSTSITPLFKMHMEYRLHFSDDSDTIIRVFQNSNEDHFEIPIKKTVIGMEVDPNNWVLNKVGWVSVSVDTPSSLFPFTITPNPVSDYLIVTYPTSFTMPRLLQLINTMGKTISEFTCKTATTTINVENLTPGMYFIKDKSLSNSSSVKFIKQ